MKKVLLIGYKTIDQKVINSHLIFLCEIIDKWEIPFLYLAFCNFGEQLILVFIDNIKEIETAPHIGTS